MKKIMLFASIVMVAVTVAACTNMKQSLNHGTNSLINPSFTTSSTSFTHTVQSVSISALTTGSPPDLKLALSVNTTAAGFQPLTQFCDSGTTTTKPCVCEITWRETNTVGGMSTSIDRTKKLALSDPVQSGLVKCQMTQAFWGEIPDGTTMRMNIIGVSPNITGLNVQSVGYKKGTSIAPAGDFVDDTLTPFRNIYRYTCFSKHLSSHEVLNKFTAATTGGATPTTVNVMIGSAFCTESGTGCQTPRNGFSAQSYYRNLFIRSDKLGEINSTNSRYDCPKVFESISYSATNPVTVPPAEQSRYWPLDTTFAVATTSSSEWSIQIPAASVLMKNGDATAVDELPAGVIKPADRLQELGAGIGIAWKIMGYGKKPNADGTCGTIVDSNGRTRPLTRLRRYRVVYPSLFENSGKVVVERTEADQVYVSDRLVVNAGGTLTGNMIYGPKPCNFAWFDHEGVTNRTTSAALDFQTNFKGTTAGSSSWPTYQATSNYAYTIPAPFPNAGVIIPVNPDGRALPNVDRDGAVGGIIPPSCSATISIYDELMGVPSKARLITSYTGRTDKITLGTRDLYLNEIHINPLDRWSPDYMEDTSFQACVPVADPYLEPPLHFYKDASSNVAWCAKVYPTQNPYWVDLNSRKKPLGALISNKAINWTAGAKVSWFTSHIQAGALFDAHNSCTGTAVDKICEWSLGTTASADYNFCKNSYLASAVVGITNRCDRSVMFDSNQQYRGFPLQAKDVDIETMLKNDLAKNGNYSCTYSVNSNPVKINKNQPLSNCCGVKAGVSILDTATKLPASSGGHLEPYLNGAVPNIRFCGSPVE